MPVQIKKQAASPTAKQIGKQNVGLAVIIVAALALVLLIAFIYTRTLGASTSLTDERAQERQRAEDVLKNLAPQGASQGAASNPAGSVSTPGR